MKILYGNLENDGIHVYIDENNNLFIADDQTVFQYENTQKNIDKLIKEARNLVKQWNLEKSDDFNNID